MVGLILNAYLKAINYFSPLLTWRDVQALIVQTAQITSPVDEGWKRNEAGFHFNHKFGFGRLDAGQMVQAAKNWVNIPPQRKCTAASGFDHQDIPKGDSLNINILTVACESSSAQIVKVEHVILTVSFVHRRRGDVSIDLISPKETRSEMLSPRRYDDSDEGLDEWNFMTVYNWGENPKGTWRMNITDNPNQDDAMNLFTNDADDVESLEEQVIDTQTKQNKGLWEKMRKEDPYFDAPYPTGVRKDNVAKHYVSEDRIEYDRSEIPTTAADDVISGDDRSAIPQYDQYVVPVKKGTLAVFDEKVDDGADEDFTGDLMQKKDLLTQREKKDVLADERKEIYKYYNKLQKDEKLGFKNVKYNKAKISKKVQVQEEETGTQRVQVNAGYENPRIACESGDNRCSGVLLKYTLTLYGTGE